MQALTGIHQGFPALGVPRASRIGRQNRAWGLPSVKQSLTEAVRIELSRAGDSRHISMTQSNQKLSNIQVMLEALEAIHKRFRPHRIGGEPETPERIANLKSFVEKLTTLKEDAKEEAMLSAEVMSKEERSNFIKIEALKLHFREDDLTTREGIENFLKQAKDLEGVLQLFRNYLEVHIRKIYHEIDKSEREKSTSKPKGALASAIEARELAASTSSSLNRGLDILLGLEEKGHAMRVAALLRG